MQKNKSLLSLVLLNSLVFTAMADTKIKNYAVTPEDITNVSNLFVTDQYFSSYGLNSNNFANRWLQGLRESASCGASSLEAYIAFTNKRFTAQSGDLLTILTAAKDAGIKLKNENISAQRRVDYNVTAAVQRDKVNVLKINKALTQDRIFEILKLNEYLKTENFEGIRVSDGITNIDFHAMRLKNGENVVHLGKEIEGGHRIDVSEAGLKKITNLVTAIKKLDADIDAQTSFLSYTEEIEKMQKAETQLFPTSTELSTAITMLETYRTTMATCKAALPAKEDTDIKAHTLTKPTQTAEGLIK